MSSRSTPKASTTAAGSESLDPFVAWLGVLFAAAASLVGGALLFPRRVLRNVVWRHFWAPLVVDARGATCAVWNGGSTVVRFGSCSGANGLVVGPGTTTVALVGYAAAASFFLAGTVFALRRFEVGESRQFVYAFVPYVLFGGVLAALAAVDAAATGGASSSAGVFGYPASLLLVRPVVYAVPAVAGAAVLGAGVWLQRNRLVDRYQRVVVGGGFALLGVAAGRLFTTGPVAGGGPNVAAVLAVLVATTLLSVVVWAVVARLTPSILSGTGALGLVIVWGHLLAGVATVAGVDWSGALGLAAARPPTNPLFGMLVDATRTALPASVVSVVGAGWPAVLVRLAVALGIVSVFDEELLEPHPRMANVLLVVLFAVGAVPGVRDALALALGV